MAPDAVSARRIVTRFGIIACAFACASLGEVARADNPVAIEGLSGDLRSRLEALLPDREKPETGFDAERLASEAAERARAYLRSEGYYAATVDAEVTETPPAARLKIAPGRQFTLSAPNLAYEGDAPAPEAVEAVQGAVSKLEPGAPARAADVLQAEAAAVAALQSEGYPDAKAGARRVVVDHATGLMTPSFSFAAGARARLGDVRVASGDLLRKKYADNLGDWERGKPYDPKTLTELRRGLASTGAFSVVTADLAPETNSDGTRDVIVKLEPAKKRVLELGASWSSAEGVGIDASWTRRNVTRRADSLTLSTVLAEQQQSLTAALERPNAIGAGRRLTLSSSIVHDDTAAFERDGVSASATIDAAPRLPFGLSYGVNVAADFYNEDVGPNDAYTLGAFVEARFDETDSLFDPRSGYIVRLRAEPAASFGDATTTFVRGSAEARGYYTPGAQKNTFAARVRTGWIEPITGDDADLPLDRRFFAGGGGSVRGYEYASISPDRTAATTPIGGRGLLEVSAEARRRFTDKVGGVVFVDGGNAFNSWSDAADLQWGAGVGLRYDLGFAPLRVDLAVPLDKRKQDSGFAIYVSIGQAF